MGSKDKQNKYTKRQCSNLWWLCENDKLRVYHSDESFIDKLVDAMNKSGGR